MARANPVSLPSLMDEPVPGRIGVITAESFERSFRDELGLAQQRGALILAQFCGGLRWMNLCTPQNLVRHPVADSGKTVLHEQDAFDRRFPMSIHEVVDEFLVELPWGDFRRRTFPPIRFLIAVMKPNTAKLARVGENKRAVTLTQNEMIVFAGSII